MNDSELIDNILNAVHDVYRLSDGGIRVSFLFNNVEHVLSLNDDVDTPFWKAIQAILKEHRLRLMLMHGELVDIREDNDK